MTGISNVIAQASSIFRLEVSPQWSVLPSCILEDVIEVGGGAVQVLLFCPDAA